MPTVDFPNVDEATEYTIVTPGKYRCILDTIGVTSTKNGDEMWGLTWVIQDGEHKGQKIYDNLVFGSHPAALGRVKLICSRLGLDTTKKYNLTPEMLDGRAALITVTVEEYLTKSGTKAMKNKIPFAGYESVEGQPPPRPDADDSDVPI